jgi:hypothetical protein
MSTHKFVTAATVVIRSKIFILASVTVVAALVVGAALSHTSSSPLTKPIPKSMPKSTDKVAPLVVAPATNPLTGLGLPPPGPVVAVTIDDTAAGRPSLGVEQADVIYIEQAEGGLSRMVAVFASSKPQVEAVRSVRESNPELLADYGRIVLVASGGDSLELAPLDQSPLYSTINDRGGVGFHRDSSRVAPYNLVANLAQISTAFKTAAGVRNVGFTWAVSDPRLTLAPAAPYVNTLVGSTPVSFAWNAKTGLYERTIGGLPLLAASGSPIAKPNVLIQYTQITSDDADVDTAGNPAMYTHTVGTGKVELFRNGKHIQGTWTRANQKSLTTFADASGKPLWLAPGGTFVVLARANAPS